MRTVKKGATSQSLYFDVLDSTSTTGGRKTGLAYNTSSLTAYYVRSQNAATAITLATLAAANTAWSSGGFKEVDATNMPGIYRLDVPDAAFAAGAGDSVAIVIKGATGMVQASCDVQLVAWDPQDTVRAGLTALPNAAAEAAGGLFTRGTGAGQINQPANGMVDANVVRNAGTAITAAAGVQEVKVASIAAGAITATAIAADAITDAKVASDVTIASVTGTVGSVSGAVGSVTGNVGGNVTGSVGSVAAGGITSGSFAAGAIDNAAIATDAIGSAELASSAVTEIQTGLATSAALSTLQTSVDDVPTNAELATALAGADDAVLAQVALVKAKTDNLPADPADASDVAGAFTSLQSHGDGAWATATGFSTLDAAAVAAAVWDGAMADHLGAGTTGDAIFQAGVHAPSADSKADTIIADIAALNNLSAGDVNAQADQALADAGVTSVRMAHLDADITSRLASGAYTAPDNASITAIKAKTDNLPSDPADQSLVIAATDALAALIGDVPTNAELATALGTADDAVLAAIAALTIPTASANASALLAAAYEGSESVQDFLRLARAALYGKANGLAGSTVHFRDLADAKNRLTATVDSDGNRSAVTTDAT